MAQGTEAFRGQCCGRWRGTHRLFVVAGDRVLMQVLTSHCSLTYLIPPFPASLRSGNIRGKKQDISQANVAYVCNHPTLTCDINCLILAARREE